MNSRKTRLILAVAVAAAILGYKMLKPTPETDAGGNAAQAAAAPLHAGPVKPRMLGRIAFKPCSLRSPSRPQTRPPSRTYASGWTASPWPLSLRRRESPR